MHNSSSPKIPAMRDYQSQSAIHRIPSASNEKASKFESEFWSPIISYMCDCAREKGFLIEIILFCRLSRAGFVIHKSENGWL